MAEIHTIFAFPFSPTLQKVWNGSESQRQQSSSIHGVRQVSAAGLSGRTGTQAVIQEERKKWIYFILACCRLLRRTKNRWVLTVVELPFSYTHIFVLMCVFVLLKQLFMSVKESFFSFVRFFFLIR